MGEFDTAEPSRRQDSQDNPVDVYRHWPILKYILGTQDPGTWQRFNIVFVTFVWLLVLSIAIAVEEGLWEDEFSPFDTERITLIESIYLFSVLISMMGLFLFCRAAFTRYERLFISDDGVRRYLDENYLNREYRELQDSSLRFINHSDTKGRRGFVLLTSLGIAYFLIMMYLTWADQSDGFLQFWAWSSLSFFLLIVAGPSLAWRLLATIHQTRKILLTVHSKGKLRVPTSFITTEEGLGQVYSFAMLTALTPLMAVPALVAWILVHKQLFIVTSIGVAIVIAVVSFLAFYSSAGALASIVKSIRQRELDDIDARLEELRIQIDDSETGDDELNRASTQFERLNELRTIRRDEAIWPFSTLVGLLGATLGETAAVVLSTLV